MIQVSGDFFDVAGRPAGLELDEPFPRQRLEVVRFTGDDLGFFAERTWINAIRQLPANLIPALAGVLEGDIGIGTQ